MPSVQRLRPTALTPATIRSKYGDQDRFLAVVSPKTQVAFARQPEKAVMGQYPTLADINETYGRDYDVDWLLPQLYDLSTFTGAVNLGPEQQDALARTLAVECQELKVTEVMLFFYRFKTGRYGRFYGAVDPMVVMTALQDFLREREELQRKGEQHIFDEYCEAVQQVVTNVLAVVTAKTGISSSDVWLSAIDPYRRRLRISIANETVGRTILANSDAILTDALPLLPPDTVLSIYLNTMGGTEMALKTRENINADDYPTEGEKRP